MLLIDRIVILYIGGVMAAIPFGDGSIGLNTDVIEKLRLKGIDPIEKLADLLLETVDPELQFKILKELAGYTTPKLKSTEVKIKGRLDHGVAILKFQDVNPAMAAQLAVQMGARITEGEVSTSLDEAAARRLRGETATPLDRQVLAKVRRFAEPSGAMIEHLRHEGEKEMPARHATEVVTTPITEGDGHPLPFEEMSDDQIGEVIDAIATPVGRPTEG